MRRIERGFTLLELQLVCVIIGVLSMVIVPRVFGATDRARVAAAIADVQTFRSALSIYEIDYGAFPNATRNSVARLSADLEDPNGNIYMVYPEGDNFDDFQYRSSHGGQEYMIFVTANDQNHTRFQVDLSGITMLN
ncbi:MAG: type II secretion system protein GspG [Calditrichaeota bacterium]|nr:type II secretion system protein GspG [Calditrichota bacterium]MCB9369539.1 type II secretion system protein GspG [Calditrichota bacterium]